MALLASALAATVTIVAALLPPLHIPGVPDSRNPPLYPAPPGYLLPWPGGEIHSVTQGEDTPFTHNGFAAYAFDFDLVFDSVVAARSGKVTMVKADSSRGGCDPAYTSDANYVVIDHGDGTSALYLHLAYDSVLVHAGDVVQRGQPIATSGETGVTCSADDRHPGPHLHFQVERTEAGQYYTQSLPIAFDDISAHDGVPQEGASYASQNYPPGSLHAVWLVRHRVPRAFHPMATPLNPSLMEAPPPPALAASGTATAAATSTPTPIPTALSSATPTPTPTATATITPTATATATITATPTATAAPSPSPSPTVAASPTPAPATSTPAPAPSPTTAPAATPVATPSPAA
ncbi:MAG: peptidoglycan DD-metalloendopeptidase family protein [Chloroflexota bacterium]|nr:peptidoglycan DD-metalloendopeptidase family protein [Chloroflexota bacterium]